VRSRKLSRRFMSRITIIETGLVSERTRARYGSFPQMFERMIGAADASIDFDTVSIINGEPFPDPGALQAILITGSPAGVYDEFDWIAPLEDFVRKAYTSQTPMVGVCFGHQLMAQALGGTVRKSEKGWGIGRHVYDIAPGNGVIEGERILPSGPGDRAAARGANDPVLGFHRTCRTALRQWDGGIGAAASGVRHRLCPSLL
jgi:GMP synthase-like glutamine amidotransferase